MDEIVRQAMQKWPNVPNCYGWLGLDARGDWFMRDDRVQSFGAFASRSPGSKGVRLAHDKLIVFIGRNYAADPCGCWYFQNGPQRVYVELEVTPWVYRIHPQGTVQTHTGIAVDCQCALTDERGWVYLLTPMGLGVVHTQDVALAAQAIEEGRWILETVKSAELPQQFGYVLSPDRAR